MTIKHSPEEMADIVAARLAQISRVNGYETDAGLRLYRGRRSVSNEQLPCVTLIEDSNEPKDRPGRSLQYEVMQRYTLLIYLPLTRPEDQDNPNAVLHKGLRDLKRCIFKPGDREDINLEGACRDVEYLGHDMAPREDGSISCVAGLEIGVTYVELLVA